MEVKVTFHLYDLALKNKTTQDIAESSLGLFHF